jgi:hypothetical protein
MSNALVRTEGMQPRDITEAKEFSRLVASSALLPPDLRNRLEDVFVIVVSGHELGLAPMQALRSIHVIQGKPVMSAELMVALVKRNRDVCEYFTLVDSTPLLATYATKRAGEPEPTRMTYTIEEARAARLADKDNWKKHTAAMLRARCSAALARAVYPDLVLGVYETDEGEELRREAPVVALRSEPPAVDGVVEEAPRALAAPPAAAPGPTFEQLNDRLHKLAGYEGDAGKAARKAWWCGALGYRDVGPRWSPFTPYTKADAETKAHVLAQLEKLESAGADDLPTDFAATPEREAGEEG